MSIRPARILSSKGFTLVEVLVAVTLTLILLTAVVKVFSGVGDGISKSKKVLEEFDRLRLAEAVLRQDLGGITVSTMPPWRPDENKGYFEYIENGYSYDPPAVILDPSDPRSKYTALTAANASNPPTPNNGDNTVGQRGDILMFTTRNPKHPFIGRFKMPPLPDGSANPNNTVQSDVAEVAWFLRGKTLHRRMLLVAPGMSTSAGTLSTYFKYYPDVNKNNPQPQNFYHDNDISIHRAVNPVTNKPIFVANSLSDLAHRENRFGHPTNVFPFDVRAQWGLLGLPTIRECADMNYMKGIITRSSGDLISTKGFWNSGSFPTVPVGPTKSTISQVDLWQNFCSDGNTTSPKYNWLPDWYLNLPTGTIQPSGSTQYTSRDADDIILTNVIGFDVKAWDPPNPTATGNNAAAYTGGYFDLGNGSYHFKSNGAGYYSGLPSGISQLTQVYDTFPMSYESDGVYQYYPNGSLQMLYSGGWSNNGFDDTNYGMVDGPGDYLTFPPYNVPLRGIQIKIRIFEPSSRQIREVTIEHDFLPK